MGLVNKSLLSKYTKGSSVQTGSSEPSSPSIGDLFINTSTNILEIYYAGIWQTLHTLSGGGGGNGYWNDTTNTWNDLTATWNQT